MGLLDRISAKIELFRLEQRYTKSRHRRSTFVSDAIYVDGEYIYANPSPRKRHSAVYYSSSEESMSTADDLHTRQESRDGKETESMEREREHMRGMGVMPGMGSAGEETSNSRGRSRWNSARAFKRRSMLTVREVNWEEEQRRS